MLKIFKIFLVSLLLLINFRCSNNTLQDCTGGVCTEEFVSITISIMDVSGNPVKLDSYKAILEDTDQNIAPELSNMDNDSFGENGIYVIFSDRFAKDYQNKRTMLNFIGIKNDQEIISSVFEVGADCCHVKLLSGNRDIIL
ncbi:hypothetical protein [Maribacter sp. 2210JD10-5]|uniref:hypothetical protein n=1 Tax=Maribacter sp. 2210JD10-5 TaxID=3386272 RepID=UPI0039BD5380